MFRWEIEQKIVIRALKDPEFKKQLLSQPKETIRAFLKNEEGIDLSLLNRLHVRIAEEKMNEWILPLPHVSNELGVLSDTELEKLFAADEGVPDTACHTAW